MTKSSVPLYAMAVMLILSLIHRAGEAAKALAPVGYEDDEGFHFDSLSRLD